LREMVGMSLFTHLGRAVGWLVLIAGVMGVTWAIGAEGWTDRWGATDDEVAATLPGDALIEAPTLVTTRALTVRAPADGVWPWIVQFGQGRGGLYSYDWLERLFGIDMTSADAILPAEQRITVGDQIWITQPGYPADLGHVVAEVQPGRALVLASSTPSRPTAPEDAPWTWSFVLRPAGDDTTRLIVRNRNESMGTVGDAVWDRIVTPIGFAMERRTMLGIAQRAEAAAGVDTGWSGRETVWFGALLATGAAVLAIAATRAPWRRRGAYVTGLTAAATLVLFRFPSALAAAALAIFSCVVAVRLRKAWATAQPPPRTSTTRDPGTVPAG